MHLAVKQCDKLTLNIRLNFLVQYNQNPGHIIKHLNVFIYMFKYMFDILDL